MPAERARHDAAPHGRGVDALDAATEGAVVLARPAQAQRRQQAVNEWMQAHTWHILIALVAFHAGAMAEWWSKREPR